MTGKALLCLMILLLWSFSTSAIAQEKTSDKTDAVFSFDTKQEQESPDIGRVLFILLVMLLVIVLLSLALKKIVYRNQKTWPDSSLIEVSASKKVSMKLTVHLVEVENTKYIITEKDNSISIVPHLSSQSSDEVS